MRILSFKDRNWKIMDIDEQTSIGIDIQCYDIKDPGKRKITCSNNFTIPATTKNLDFFGFSNNPYITDNDVKDYMYRSIPCKYSIDNVLLIKGYIEIEEIGDRISCVIKNIEDVFDVLKTLYWTDSNSYRNSFIYNFLVWSGLPMTDSRVTLPEFYEFLAMYKDHDKICLPSVNSNFYNVTDGTVGGPGEVYEDARKVLVSGVWGEPSAVYDYYPSICLFAGNYDQGEYNGYGAHWAIYFTDIIHFIEDTYGINFYSQGGGFIGNIFDDSTVKNLLIFAPDIILQVDENGADYDYWFNVAHGDPTKQFPPYQNLIDKSDKSIYSLLDCFMKYFHVIKDEIYINGEYVIALRRFDDMDSQGNQNVINFSGKLTNKVKYKPNLPNIKHYNYIRFEYLFDGAPETAYQRTLDSQNLMVGGEGELFKIPAYIGNSIDWGGGDYVPNLTEEAVFQNWIFLINDGYTANNIEVNYYIAPQGTYQGPGGFSTPLVKVGYMGITNEYVLFEQILRPLRFYEIEKFLTINDIQNLQFFNQHYIKELGGSFFINKISGFNPDKSLQPCKIEVFKVSNRVPDPITGANANVYIDGVGGYFTDGSGQFFY